MLSASVPASVVILPSNRLQDYLEMGDFGRPFLFLYEIDESYALHWHTVPD